MYVSPRAQTEQRELNEFDYVRKALQSGQADPPIRALAVETKLGTAHVLHSRPSHVTHMNTFVGASSCSMQYASVIPDDHVAVTLPGDSQTICGLRHMRQQLIDELSTLLRRHALDMVHI